MQVAIVPGTGISCNRRKTDGGGPSVRNGMRARYDGAANCRGGEQLRIVQIRASCASGTARCRNARLSHLKNSNLQSREYDARKFRFRFRRPLAMTTTKRREREMPSR
jgi:hypothetical protein